ncbi:MAG: hypothetical protein WDN25_02210 [Acetobacteraceae bacterium]
MAGERLADLQRFYDILDRLERRLGGMLTLETCSRRAMLPSRGVYFFFESGEIRRESGEGPRVVRIGTHALSPTSRTTLRERLYQHRGNAGDRNGNHRGSVFRNHVGMALLESDDGIVCPTWGCGNSASAEIRAGERQLEIRVSAVIGAMPFLWLEVDGDEGAAQRSYVERQSIGLLSNFAREGLDGASAEWLGHRSRSPRVRESGLWNSNHVSEHHAPEFLDRLATLASAMPRAA